MSCLFLPCLAHSRPRVPDLHEVVSFPSGALRQKRRYMGGYIHACVRGCLTPVAWPGCLAVNGEGIFFFFFPVLPDIGTPPPLLAVLVLRIVICPSGERRGERLRGHSGGLVRRKDGVPFLS